MSVFKVFRTSYNRNKDPNGDWVDNNKVIDHEVVADYFELSSGEHLDSALVFYAYNDADVAKPVAAFNSWDYVLKVSDDA